MEGVTPDQRVTRRTGRSEGGGGDALFVRSKQVRERASLAEVCRMALFESSTAFVLVAGSECGLFMVD